MPQTLQCPNCHAPLDVDPKAPSFQCSYCGHHSKNTLYSPPQPKIPRPPSPQIAQPQQMVQQAQKSVKKVVYIIIAISIFISLFSMVPILCISAGVQTVVSTVVQSGLQSSSGTQGSSVNWSWQSYRPFIVDANGDGVEDVVGRIQVDHKAVFLAAVSGQNFQDLWRSTEIATEAVPYLAEDKIVLTETNIVTGYHLGSGKRAWATTLSDKIKEVGLQEGSLRIFTIDKKWYLINLQTGAMASDSAAKPLRYDLRTDKGFELIPSMAQLDLGDGKWKNLRVWRAFCEEEKITKLRPNGRPLPWHSRKAFCEAPQGLALLTRSSGSKIPFLIGYDTKTKAKLWERQLTPPGSLDELESGFRQPRAALFDDRALFIYLIDEGPYKMELISLPDGKVLWQGAIPSGAQPDHLYGAMLTRSRAYVKVGWGPIQVFNAEDGSTLASIGQ